MEPRYPDLACEVDERTSSLRSELGHFVCVHVEDDLTSWSLFREGR